MSEAAARLLAEIRALPRQERLRLIEQATHELDAEEDHDDPASIIGSMASEAELLDEIVGSAMHQRRQLPLRRPGA